MPLRIIFMGTPEFAVPTLAGLHEAGHEIVGVFSQPPRQKGRGMQQIKSPVQMKAEQLGIDVFTPANLKTPEELARISNFDADIAVVVAYGHILPQSILSAPRLGCINGHASLLPRWRGAAPIQRAIEAGDRQSGVCIMQMETGLDTGPVLICEEIDIDDNMNAGALHDLLSQMTARLMVASMALLEAGKAKFTPQSEAAVSYAKKIEKSETRINWHRPARQVHDHIRAMAPFPGAWFEADLAGKNTRIKLLQSEVVSGSGKPGEILDQRLTIACEDGAIRPLRLQKSGKQANSLDEFLRGNSIAAGEVLE